MRCPKTVGKKSFSRFFFIFVAVYERAQTICFPNAARRGLCEASCPGHHHAAFCRGDGGTE